MDYDDGVKLFGVREEYIRVIGSKDGASQSHANMRLQEGMRVHARAPPSKSTKGGRDGGREGSVFLPGHIARVYKGGMYDVECEGGKMIKELTLDDLWIGLEEGVRIEARRPTKVNLQCTSISWTCTGSSIAASYGRLDITGWCDHPGAVCVWNLFSKDFNASNPHFVLDHTSCLMSCKCHPINPSLIAAGSFNGEVVVWDLTSPEKALCVSPISDYSHKDPIVDISWVWSGGKEGGGGAGFKSEWLICTVGTDGKVLLWSLTNKLAHPVKGVTLAEGKVSKRYVHCIAINTINMI